MPAHLVLETFEDPESAEEKGFITVSSARIKKIEPSLMSFPQTSFCQVTYRTYVLFKGIPCVFFLGFDLSTWPSFTYRRLSALEVEKGKIEVLINKDPSGGYDIYECKGKSGHGSLDFYLRAKERASAAPPFEAGADKVKFFNERYHNLFRTSAGVLGDQVVEKEEGLTEGFSSGSFTREGELIDFQSDYWVKLGLLKEEEAEDKLHSVLVTPYLDLVYYPVVPAMLMPKAA